MLTFVMLTRLSPDAARSPQALEQIERKAMERIRKECPDVEWISNYAILGPCDYLDVFRARDVETAAKFPRSSALLAMLKPKFGRRRNGAGSRTSFASFDRLDSRPR